MLHTATATPSHCHVAPLQSLITDNILLGGREDAENAGQLAEWGVTHILNTAQQLPCYFPQNFVYLKVSLLGEQQCFIEM